MILLYFYFIFLLFISYIIYSDETLFITKYNPIPQWEPINNESKSQNFFITNEHQETNLTSSIQRCMKESYTSNVIQEDEHTYRVAIYKNHFETVFSINLYHITYESLLQLLDNDRLNKINSTDTNPDNILLLEFKFHYGDLLSYHECFKYVKNNYDLSIEKSKRICYKQDLSFFKPREGVVFKYDHTNPHHLAFIISLLYKNKKIGIDQFKIIHDINRANIDDPIISYQLLSLMLHFFSFKRVKYQDIPTKQSIDNIIFYSRLKMTLYNIKPSEDVSKKYITAYKTCGHTYINRFIIENMKSLFCLHQLKLITCNMQNTIKHTIKETIQNKFRFNQYRLL